MTTIRLLGKLRRDSRGGTAIEYGLILALVVLAIMAALVAFAGASTDIWSNVSAKVIAAGR
jgi:pilus assembly protein Flp/PilA